MSCKPTFAGLLLVALGFTASGCGDDAPSDASGGGSGSSGGASGSSGSASGSSSDPGAGGGGSGSGPGGGTGVAGGGGSAPPSDPHLDPAPGANTYSWDGSWTPSADDFPIEGMVDETHATLPPGKWGWDNACDCPGDEGTAIYDNEYVGKGVELEQVQDDEGRLFGWRMISTGSGGIAFDHRADHFEGSTGVDIVDMNPDGEFLNSPGLDIGDGPDILRYSTGRGVDARTGSDTKGALRDNDLVILGSERQAGLNEYEIEGTTIHTGPGADLVFARNFGAAAVDLGNGQSGRTDAVDASDGDDVAVLQGNMRDFRVFGGNGSDTFIWYVDEANDDRWLGPAFFGCGGWGDAIWADDGTDRLVLVVPPDTTIAPTRPEHDGQMGSLLAFIYLDYEIKEDAPTVSDPFARYYSTVPDGPNGERTITLGYRSESGSVDTADFYITNVDEIQLGLGPDAVVYTVNHETGALTLDASLAPLEQAPDRGSHNALVDTFGR
jgi:hypothetical protein